MNNLLLKISDIKELPLAAKAFLDFWANQFFFAFYGDLGAGKTTFIKALCKTLGSTDNIVSPTFSIVNEYSLPKTSSEKKVIYHMDLFRLKNEDEALDIGIYEYFNRTDAYCFIEWPQKIESFLPEDIVRVQIKAEPDNSRIIQIL